MTRAEIQGQPTAEVSAGSSNRAAAVSQLFREHNRALVLFLASRLKDVQAAREVAQEAYVRVLELENLAAVGFLRSYLFKVAGNLAIDRMRQQQSRARLDRISDFDDFLDNLQPERTVIAREELAFLGRVVGELPAKYQQAFRMHRLEDQPFEEIARQMGLKERMVRCYVTNALLYLTPLRVRRNPSFHGPTDDRPMLMIGSGTGIAGLRAHMHRRVRLQHRRNWLICGERNAAYDSFYAEELRQWRAAGYLEGLDLVFSRDPSFGRYVQDRLLALDAQVRAWIDAGAAIYVCGSARGMAPSVHDRLTAILGEDQLEFLARNRRYLRDVY